ncbi:MAG: twin-arginine translocation signal domain-containing protein [Thermoguttaceae bacterium]|nr:twin-arginine translocation signal domain-containing protein [Thermoguttaceae bacterium]
MALLERRNFLKGMTASAAVFGTGAFIPSLFADDESARPIEVDLSTPSDVTDDEINSVYQEIQTPYKYGIVLPQEDGDPVDSPNIFRVGGVWYMLYLRFLDKTGYVAKIAKSDDLLKWESLGVVVPFRESGWDAWQCSPSAALVDHRWGGSYAIEPFDGKYWFTYIGGEGKGYEPDPLKIGLAYTDDPGSAKLWKRFDKPIMSPSDPDAREFEKTTMYKTSVIWDRDKSLGYQFVCFYNGKGSVNGKPAERIGIAVSNDLTSWRRYGNGPVIDNGSGISGDPQIVRMGDLWVMFYFGAFWKPKAFETFAVSRDLVHWRKWDGPHLVEPSEPFDQTYAHKPWVIKHDGVVYHFYNAVGDQGRCIALATSKKL